MAVPSDMPAGLVPIFQALDDAEASAQQGQSGRALAHVACARILLTVYGLNQAPPAASDAATARLLAAMDMVAGETAQVIDLAERRARREPRG